MAYLAGGPASSRAIARDVLGIVRPGRVLADRVAVALLQADARVARDSNGRWVPAGGPSGECLTLDAARFAVVDVETTGRRPQGGDRVIEIAVAVTDGGGTRLVFDHLIHCGQAPPPTVTALTGISTAMLHGAPTFGDVADRLVGVLAGGVFAAHNAAFDWAFVSGELARARGLLLAGPRVCTLRLARRLLPGLERRTLDAVAAYFGIGIRPRHRAGGDALATARVLERLLVLARERGARTVDDLQRLPKRMRNAECTAGVGRRASGAPSRVGPPDALRPTPAFPGMRNRSQSFPSALDS